MKEMPFEKIASMYDPLIKSQIKLYHLSNHFDQYYQAGLLGLWRAYETFNPEKGTFSSYAFLLVRGSILQELRGEARRQKAEEIQDPHESMTFKTLSHEDTIPYLEDVNMNLYLIHLTENQQRWVVQRVVQMKSEAEIAEMYGVTVYAVKSWRKSAIKRLRTVLSAN
ncbi:sigma-70 family RNA polymerase sigma factor [Fictibacillus phosphorivorans]|uniref:sigma-70 family RNA polymerase sigma factor n=1 Tax=Fictibacillus phosphorivorans TaxID=1221500 RepID=UPI0020403DC6|nr:sigma-70 family RNA polymerase sigma factor [Fictibacillus phosphorivorans]MCM3717640.1 sigma-70 family RNA polymerase sigma factor [Fictibacillus phosphorivorans]MCM3775540.1 sigma-70 family RNA polymerase sigma factor [Fictibacillus phosphorivorans]